MKTNELTGAALDWPERESLADLEYAQTTPEDWTEDYKQCWQQLQVCERNKIILWKHAKTLKGAVEYERAEKVKYFKLYNDVCETAQLRLQEIARLDASLKNSAPPQREELRRLHEVNAELVEALRTALDTGLNWRDQAFAAIAKATGEQQ